MNRIRWNENQGMIEQQPHSFSKFGSVAYGMSMNFICGPKDTVRIYIPSYGYFLEILITGQQD